MEIWGNTYPTHINGILLLQESIMSGAKRLDHANSLFSTFACLKINIIELKTLLFMYKAYFRCLPSNIQRFFRWETTYSLRASHDLERLRVCSTMRSMYLCIYRVRLWNSQSDDIKKH